MKFLTTSWIPGVLFPVYIFVVIRQWVWLKGVTITNSCHSYFLHLGRFGNFGLEYAVFFFYCLCLNSGLCPKMPLYLNKCLFLNCFQFEGDLGHEWVSYVFFFFFWSIEIWTFQVLIHTLTCRAYSYNPCSNYEKLNCHYHPKLNTYI